MSDLHVVFGAGPVGTSTATSLTGLGHRVRVVSRSGRGPAHPSIELVALDVADPRTTAAACEGATTMYNALNPAYHRWSTDWPPLHRSLMAAATSSGAALVMMDNLYSYGDPAGRAMRAGDPMQPNSEKGRVRAQMAAELLQAHRAGELRATIARAGDFVGPDVVESSLGERVVPKVLAGKAVKVVGSLDAPHAFTYMPDIGRTLAVLGTDPRALGRIWLVPSPPAITQRQAVALLAEAGGRPAKVSALPRLALRAAGLFVPMIRELDEVMYQFERPFVMDASETVETFGITPASWDEIARATVAWWRARLEPAARAA